MSGSLVSWGAPLAAGSGIPEIKTYLNGVRIRGAISRALGRLEQNVESTKSMNARIAQRSNMAVRVCPGKSICTILREKNRSGWLRLQGSWRYGRYAASWWQWRFPWAAA